jgi:PleD family two-component response regulator
MMLAGPKPKAADSSMKRMDVPTSIISLLLAFNEGDHRYIQTISGTSEVSSMTDPITKVLMFGTDYDPEDGLRVTLLRRGYLVHIGRSEAEGLSELASWCPDIVLIDLSSQGLEDANICKRVRAKSDAQIIGFAVNRDPSFLVEVLDAGADDFVWKPFSLAVVEARIRARVRQSRQARGSSQLHLA